MARDLARELEEWDGTFPPSWRPQEGETLVGTIERYSTGQNAYGPCRTVLLRRDDGQRVSIWLSSTVLLDLFKREKPKVGERVGIRYLGRHPQKNYHRYALVVDRDDEEPSFAPLGGERIDREEDDGDSDGYFSATASRPAVRRW